MQLHVLGILCGLGAVVFAAISARRRYVSIAFVCGFAFAAFGFWIDRIPEPGLLGVAVAGVAGLVLLTGSWLIVAAACCGVISWIWAALLTVQGLPLIPSLVAALAAPLVAVLLVRRRERFAPKRLQEEALLVVAAVGLLLAAVPIVIAGWQSATALRGAPLTGESSVWNPWVIGVLATVVLIGGLYSYWKQR